MDGYSALSERFFSERVKFHNQWQAMAKDSRTHLEVHSLNSDRILFSIQLKTFSKFSGWTFIMFAFELYHSLFHTLMIKSSYLVDRALSYFLSYSFEIF